MDEVRAAGGTIQPSVDEIFDLLPCAGEAGFLSAMMALLCCVAEGNARGMGFNGGAAANTKYPEDCRLHQHDLLSREEFYKF